jgi:cell division protein FtsB
LRTIQSYINQTTTWKKREHSKTKRLEIWSLITLSVSRLGIL